MSMILRPVLQQAGSWHVPRIWCRVEEVPDPGCERRSPGQAANYCHAAHLDLDIVGGAPLQQPLLRGQLPRVTVLHVPLYSSTPVPVMYPCTPVPPVPVLLVVGDEGRGVRPVLLVLGLPQVHQGQHLPSNVIIAKNIWCCNMRPG